MSISCDRRCHSTLVSCLSVPLCRLLIALRDPAALMKLKPKVPLRISKSLLSGFPVPLRCILVALCHTTATLIELPQKTLGICISVLGGLPEPSSRLLVALHHSANLLKKKPKMPLYRRLYLYVPLLSSSSVPLRCHQVTLRCTRPST